MLGNNPQVLEFALSQCGIVIDRPWDHFTHLFTGLGTNDYHFDQKDGLTYFPGYSPYVYLLATETMLLVWLMCVWPWLLTIVRALLRLGPWFVKEMRPAIAEARQLIERIFKPPSQGTGGVAVSTSEADGEAGSTETSAAPRPEPTQAKTN